MRALALLAVLVSTLGLVALIISDIIRNRRRIKRRLRSIRNHY